MFKDSAKITTLEPNSTHDLEALESAFKKASCPLPDKDRTVLFNALNSFRDGDFTKAAQQMEGMAAKYPNIDAVSHNYNHFLGCSRR